MTSQTISKITTADTVLNLNTYWVCVRVRPRPSTTRTPAKERKCKHRCLCVNKCGINCFKRACQEQHSHVHARHTGTAEGVRRRSHSTAVVLQTQRWRTLALTSSRVKGIWWQGCWPTCGPMPPIPLGGFILIGPPMFGCPNVEGHG